MIYIIKVCIKYQSWPQTHVTVNKVREKVGRTKKEENESHTYLLFTIMYDHLHRNVTTKFDLV